jgi:hypothetical protein
MKTVKFLNNRDKKIEFRKYWTREDWEIEKIAARRKWTVISIIGGY